MNVITTALFPKTPFWKKRVQAKERLLKNHSRATMAKLCVITAKSQIKN